MSKAKAQAQSLPPPSPFDQALTGQALDNVITELDQIRNWMQVAKAREMWLRIRIAEVFFNDKKLPTGAYPEGTTNAVKEGYKAKLGCKWYRNILDEVLAPTLQELGPLPPEVGELVKTKHELSLTAYRQLDAEQQRIADKMLVIKQGAIDLDVVKLPPPK